MRKTIYIFIGLAMISGLVMLGSWSSALAEDPIPTGDEIV